MATSTELFAIKFSANFLASTSARLEGRSFTWLVSPARAAGQSPDEAGSRQMELLEAVVICFVTLVAFLAFYLHLVYRPENKTPTSQLKDVVTPSLQLDELPAALTPVQRSPAAAPQPLQSPPAPLQLNPATASPPTGRTQYSISPPPPSTSPIFIGPSSARARRTPRTSRRSPRAAAAETTRSPPPLPTATRLRCICRANPRWRPPRLAHREQLEREHGQRQRRQRQAEREQHGSEQRRAGNIKDGSSAVAVVEAQPQPASPLSWGECTHGLPRRRAPGRGGAARAAIDAEALYHAEAAKAVKGMITTASLLKQEEEAEAAAELAAAAAKLQAAPR